MFARYASQVSRTPGLSSIKRVDGFVPIYNGYVAGNVRGSKMNDIELHIVIKNSELMGKYEVINEVIDRKSLRKNSREGGEVWPGVLLLAEQRKGWSLMISCARATRGLRKVRRERPGALRARRTRTM